MNAWSKINWVRLIISLVICQMAGFIGSFFTSESVSGWYSALEKPWFNPPSWIFGPVWTTLFVLMGISLYLVWNSKSSSKLNYPSKGIVLLIFSIHLVLNILWSFLFFGLQNPGLAFIEILILEFSIIVTGILFYRISKIAGYLFLPYFIWVSFALILNLYIWILN